MTYAFFHIIDCEWNSVHTDITTQYMSNYMYDFPLAFLWCHGMELINESHCWSLKFPEISKLLLHILSHRMEILGPTVHVNILNVLNYFFYNPPRSLSLSNWSKCWHNLIDYYTTIFLFIFIYCFFLVYLKKKKTSLLLFQVG